VDKEKSARRVLEREADKGPARSVLVVDDEEIARRVLGRALEKANLRVTSVGDPVTALTLLKANSYDLLFLDIVMPGMDGFELCAKLRALPSHARTPVVFVSGTVEYEQRVQAAASGGNDIIAKPFSHTEVVAKALSLLSRSS
jgi:CheY-like chemotaxis protein